MASASKAKANLRSFIEKLNLRRRRIPCNLKCSKTVRAALLSTAKSAGYSAKGKTRLRLPCEAVKRILRNPPAGVPLYVLHHLADVAWAYDSVGDGCFDLDEFIGGALDVESASWSRLKRLLPLVLVVVWLAVAPTIYCTMEGWPMVDAYYFAVMLVLTVGQDSLEPTSEGAKIATICYALVGIVLLGWVCAGAVARLLVNYEMHLGASLRAKVSEDLLAARGFGPDEATDVALEDLVLSDLPQAPTVSELSTSDEPGDYKGKSDASVQDADKAKPLSKPVTNRGSAPTLGSQGLLRAALKLSVYLTCVSMFVVIVAVAVYNYSDDLSFVDALYWSVLTCTTVVGGRLGSSPASETDRALVIGIVVVAAPTCFLAMLAAADFFLKRRSARIQAEISSRMLPTAFLHDLNADGTGVSKLEFLCAALMAGDVVNAQDLWNILRQYPEASTEAGSQDKASASRDFQLSSSSSPERVLRSRDFQLTPELQKSGCVSDSAEQWDGQPLATWRDMVDAPSSKSDADALVRDLYQDALAVRKQLDQRNVQVNNLESQLREAEHATRHVYAERQALHGQTVLLEHKLASAQTISEELRQRLSEAERQRDKAEQMASDARCSMEELTQTLTSRAEVLAEDFRRAAAEECEDHKAAAELAELRLQEETKAAKQQHEDCKAAMRQCAEVNAQRKTELRMARLEAQAITQSQQSLRTQLRKVKAPPPPASALQPLTRSSSASLRDDNQPWKVWERASRGLRERELDSSGAYLQRKPDHAPIQRLLTGAAREHADLVDGHIRLLNGRNSQGAGVRL